MKKGLLFTLLYLGVFSCELKPADTSELSELANNKPSFDWLSGKWKRESSDTTLQTFEAWETDSSGNYSGHGFVMNQSDTVWQERMKLAKSEDTWYLDVRTVDNSEIVRFTLTYFGKDSFVVENNLHDFPKIIRYWKQKNKLKARVEGDTTKILFEFKPIHQ